MARTKAVKRPADTVMILLYVVVAGTVVAAATCLVLGEPAWFFFLGIGTAIELAAGMVIEGYAQTHEYVPPPPKEKKAKKKEEKDPDAVVQVDDEEEFALEDAELEPEDDGFEELMDDIMSGEK